MHAATVSAQPFWAMPQIAIDEAGVPAEPHVFGTIALPIRARPTSTRWAKVMKASLSQPALVRLAESAKGLPPREQVAFVQLAVSLAVRNSPAPYNCADDGYWAAANETLTRGVGDCIDIAVAKMEALRFLGIPTRDLYLTTGYFDRRGKSAKGRETAALLVRVGDTFWLMPEYSRQIYEADGSADNAALYAPMVTYGVGTTWIHGRVVKAALLDH